MKKSKLVLMALILLSSLAHAAGEIRNMHQLTPRVHRSAAPKAAALQLAQQGFTDVLIFKNETGGEVRSEIEKLKAGGIPASHIYQIPMQWDSPEGQQESCRLTVKALKILQTVDNKEGSKILFHCTVGEDRTGMLAGLFRMLNQGWKIQKAFKTEMCANGYEAGDSTKPASVVNSIRRGLTPVFIQVAYLIQKGVITKANLDPALCSSQSLQDAEYKEWVAKRDQFICE